MAHRAELDLEAVRRAKRRSAALRELVIEHGEAALRSLGGRREAERLLADADPGASVSQLLERLR